MDVKNEDILTDDELNFIRQATGDADETDDSANDLYVKEPQFPKITISIISAISVALLVLIASIMNSLSQYKTLFDNETMRAMMKVAGDEDAGLESMQFAYNIYEVRAAVYAVPVIIALIIIGMIIAIWKIRHDSWEQQVMDYDDAEGNNDE